jgi:hypothetical protein
MQLETARTLDPERTRNVRAQIGATRSLDELAAVLNSPAVAAVSLTDLAVLPTFGGERPRYIGCVSCDVTRLLIVNTQGEVADPFVLRLRADVARPGPSTPRRR